MNVTVPPSTSIATECANALHQGTAIDNQNRELLHSRDYTEIKSGISNGKAHAKMISEVVEKAREFALHPETQPEVALHLNSKCQELQFLAERITAGTEVLSEKLPALEAEYSRLQAQHEEIINRRDEYLERLKTEYDELAHKLSELLNEGFSLRKEILRANSSKLSGQKNIQDIEYVLGRKNMQNGRSIFSSTVLPSLKSSVMEHDIYNKKNEIF